MIAQLIKLRERTACWQLNLCILFTWQACSTTRHDRPSLSGRYHSAPIVNEHPHYSASGIPWHAAIIFTREVCLRQVSSGGLNGNRCRDGVGDETVGVGLVVHGLQR